MSSPSLGPVYISAHSADIILSDIRSLKFKSDALSGLNAILDEFLRLVITTAHSLSTDKLKTSLVRILPTPLGKDALLEAELELRAYRERTNTSDAPSAASNGLSESINIQWAVQVRTFPLLALNHPTHPAIAHAA